MNENLYVGVSMLSFVGFGLLSCCCYSCWVDVSQDSSAFARAGHSYVPDSYDTVPPAHTYAHSRSRTHRHARTQAKNK
jgi:hypothetical protein